jgi:ATP-dependent Clp protease ATP-binding subunit ClpC
MDVNLGAARAKKAKIAKFLEPKAVILLFKVLSASLFATAAAGIYLEMQAAWALLAPAIWLAMVIVWRKRDLSVLPPDAKQGLAGILDGKVLAGLKTSAPSGYELWQAMSNHPHTNFFTVRYLIAKEFFEQNLKGQNIDMKSVLSQAVDYQKIYGLPTISAGCLLVALFKTTPGSETLMNRLKLDVKELEDGVSWADHEERLINALSAKQNTGGIGRDWASGYTPLLNQIGHNISLEIESAGLLYRPIESRKAIIGQMLKVLAQTGKTNVALVGDVGTGKTTAVYALANALYQGLEPQLRYHQIFSLDAATLIANARHRGELEGLVSRIFNEAHHAGNVIIFLDEAQLFLEDATGSINLTNLLLPLLENTRIRLILTLTPPQWQKLSAENSALTGQMNYQLLPPANEEETLRVLEDQSIFIEGQHKVMLSYYAIREAYKLAEHYISEEAFPGKAIKLIEQSAVSAGKGSLLTSEHLQRTIEVTKGVKVARATQDESAKLLNLESELHKQMINQELAVKTVSNALRRARAGARNTNRPIGAFLFLGPTGVGKTQLAKSLAGVYFGSVANIIRVDMNEYVNSQDINRLLAPETGSGTTFLGKIRQQPFSVVLLDEIEKAHQDIINAFLQMLDEGTISDTNGRQASFKDAIIIATSNAGADKIREYISAGKQPEQFQKEFIDGIISSGYFKPELINRFDELLVFRPLSEDELVKVVDIMLKDVNKQLDEQRLVVKLDEPAKRWLVAKGNDPRLGARPMRRMIQKYVEDIVAKKVLEGQTQPGAVISITTKELEAIG